MRDYLLDIVQHTYGLGNIDLIKITGDENGTTINCISEDRSVIVEGKFKGPVADFVGTFGMPNLSKLNTILNLPVYKENAKIDVSRDGEAPTNIHFENKEGDFKNDYRFMKADVVTAILKNFKFKAVNWNIDIVPSVIGIQRLKFQSQAHNDETTFSAKTDGSDLKFFFGNPSSHSGEFVFESGVSGKLTKAWSWPVTAITNILSLTGDKTLKISDEGATMITVDSGLIEYNYILPAQTK
jgi:hypothetical protein